MRTTQNFVFGTLALIMPAIAGCNQGGMSVLIEDTTKGMNGGFEHTQQGLPVNWQLYTARTVPSGDFDILLDTVCFREGRQSLKFAVRECAPTGGRYSPGIAKETGANPGEVYKVSFWVKNHGSGFVARVAGISATDGESETIVRSGRQIHDWRHYEYSYTIPKKMNAIRFEVNVLQPGTFWIDDIRIERQRES